MEHREELTRHIGCQPESGQATRPAALARARLSGPGVQAPAGAGRDGRNSQQRDGAGEKTWLKRPTGPPECQKALGTRHAVLFMTLPAACLLCYEFCLAAMP